MGSTRRPAALAGRVIAARALALVTALVLTAGCQPRLPRSPAPTPLRVATSGDYLPFSVWPEGDAEPHGFSVDVARAYARDRGRPIDWVRFRWPGLTADLEAGRFDLALSGVTIRADRSLAGRFSVPLTVTGAVALVRADSGFRSPADLDDPAVRIAVNRGGHLEGVARRLFPHARVETVPDNAAVPARLAANRADAVVSDDLEAPHWRSSLPPTRVLGPFTRDLKAAWIPPDRVELVRDLDRWLLANERAGELGRLRRRHGLAATPTAEAIAALLASLDERLSLMPVVALAKHALGRPVEDRAQEERVARATAEAVDAAARELGATPPAAASLRRFVDAQLHAAREIQTREVARLARGEPSSSGLATPDEEAARALLDARVRPAVASISERIAWLLVAARTSATPNGVVPADARASDAPSFQARSTALPTRAAVAEAVARHDLPAAVVDELFASLDALLRDQDPLARGASRAGR